MRRIQICLMALLFTAVCATVFAAGGDPVAIRRWPDGSTTIETHWNLTLRVLPAGIAENAPALLEGNSADRIVSVTDSVDHVLHRLPNSAVVQWQSVAESNIAAGDQENAIRVKTLASSDPSSSDRATAGLMVQVDRVSILFSMGEKIPAIEKAASIDVLVAPKLTSATAPSFAAQANEAAARWIIVDKESDAGAVRAIVDKLDSDPPIESNGNTAAVSSIKSKPTKPSVVLLKTSPWTASQELEELFKAMETSCAESQNVFSKLSTEQMNFRPSNGTHTPRWNTEHMMGRQLLFFSQIYHELDPSIPVMDLNPKQMPPDYRAAHADWDGAEEARQMERVSAFTRRFAYLLQDVDLDRRAPGSRWTLRALLKQMHRHYSEHTANTVKKFDLPDWPK